VLVLLIALAFVKGFGTSVPGREEEN